jgi:ubiquinone biosynthesis protein
MLSNTKNIVRLVHIFRILAKYDALFFLKDAKAFPIIGTFAHIIAPIKVTNIDKLREGKRLSLALEELGPSFIKLGQALSVRSDIVGEKIAEDLASLRDDLPPFNSEVAINIIEKELEKPLEELFDYFEEEPVAAASIAQVHFAKNKDGEEVAVKILRPNIQTRFRRDLDLFYWAASQIERKIPKYRRLKLREVVETFASSTKMEMDFMYEAAAASELANNFEFDDDIRVPKIFWNRTTEKVLTLERFYGCKIDNLEELKANGHNPDLILKKSANIFLKQALRDGFFHADMHPGNVLVNDKGQIAVFDFGIMGRIDRKTRIFLAEMLLGFLSRDYKKVSDVHFEAGYIPQNESRELFAQACRSIGEPIMDLPQNEISIAKLLEQLFRVTEQFNMETQPQLLLLQKTMMMAEGIGRSLNPEINFWELSRELIEDWGKENLGPKARIEDKVIETREALNSFLRSLGNLEKMITDQGLNFHPDFVEQVTKRRRQDNFWKFAFLLFIILAFAVYFYG